MRCVLRRLLLTAGFVFLTVSTSAQAAWHEAKSEHFIIYSEISPKQLKEFAVKLEKFHFLLTSVSLVKDVDPGRRVVVYLLGNPGQLVSLVGTQNVKGFYTTSPRNGVAVLARASERGEDDIQVQDVLFHEYAHHFMLHYFSGAYPSWYIEGFAEFYAVVKFPKPNVIEFGHVPTYRRYSLSSNQLFPLEKLLRQKGGKLEGGDVYQFYATSWLATHFFNANPEREKEKIAYLKDFFIGKTDLPLDSYFKGGIKAVEREMRSYAGRRLEATSLETKQMPEFAVELKPLTDDVGGMMQADLRVMLDAEDEELAEVSRFVRKQAEKYPQSAFAYAVLADAEFEAGNTDAALAAADKAIALDPALSRAHASRAEVFLHRASKSRANTDWDAALASIVKANRLDTDDPLPLIQFYRYHRHRTGQIPDAAYEGLIRAYQMFKNRPDFVFLLAQELADRREFPSAIKILEPLAFSPHESDARKQAQKLREDYALAQNGGVAKTSSLSEAFDSGAK